MADTQTVVVARVRAAVNRGNAMLRQFDAVLVGALGDPRVPDNRHARDILLGTRFELDLYVNHRPVR